MNLNIPLILEGEQGQGKKTALKYVFDLLNIKNRNIMVFLRKLKLFIRIDFKYQYKLIKR